MAIFSPFCLRLCSVVSVMGMVNPLRGAGDSGVSAGWPALGGTA
jgi:hypothetical protein